MPGQTQTNRVKLHWANDAAGAGKQELGNFIGYTKPSPSTDDTDVTDSSSPPGQKEKIPGDTDYGSTTLSFNRNIADAGQNAMLADAAAGTKPQKYFQVSGGPTGVEVVIQFPGKIASAFVTGEQQGGVFGVESECSLDGLMDASAGVTIWP